MSDWNTERAAALMRLRRAQTRVVTAIAPAIATEDGAAATPSVLQLDGPRGGRYIGQRVHVERALARFVADEAFAAAEAEWNPDGTACRLFMPKADGTVRLQITTEGGELHSVTLLHEGRVLQLTSFSEELDLARLDDDAPAESVAGADAGAGDAGVRPAELDDDPLSADTLAEPPEYTPEQLREAATADARRAEGDPRPAHLAAEEREHGPDSGYRLRGAPAPGRS